MKIKLRIVILLPILILPLLFTGQPAHTNQVVTSQNTQIPNIKVNVTVLGENADMSTSESLIRGYLINNLRKSENVSIVTKNEDITIMIMSHNNAIGGHSIFTTFTFEKFNFEWIKEDIHPDARIHAKEMLDLAYRPRYQTIHIWDYETLKRRCEAAFTLINVDVLEPMRQSHQD